MAQRRQTCVICPERSSRTCLFQEWEVNPERPSLFCFFPGTKFSTLTCVKLLITLLVMAEWAYRPSNTSERRCFWPALWKKCKALWRRGEIGIQTRLKSAIYQVSRESGPATRARSALVKTNVRARDGLFMKCTECCNEKVIHRKLLGYITTTRGRNKEMSRCFWSCCTVCIDSWIIIITATNNESLLLTNIKSIYIFIVKIFPIGSPQSAVNQRNKEPIRYWCTVRLNVFLLHSLALPWVWCSQ